MISRIRLIITVVLLCHLIVVLPPVTSQLHPAASGQRASTTAVIEPLVPGEEVTIKAREQEKLGDRYHLRGDVEITFRTYVFRANEVTYDATSGEVIAQGDVNLIGGPNDEYIRATRATYNLKTETGRFHDVTGATGARLNAGEVVLTTSDPFVFSGKTVEKIGRERIIVHHGSATTCRLPDPKWLFRARRVEVIPGDNAKVYNSSFQLFGVPIFYFPFVRYPVERLGRKTGFLLPSLGRSSRKGYIFGDSFYWAINRSMDATIGAEYYSRRGWAQNGEFRARPSTTSFINARFFGVLDRGVLIEDASATTGRMIDGRFVPAGTAIQDQGGHEIQLEAEGLLPYGFRGVASVDYLSSYLFRFSFSDAYTEAINSEARSIAFVNRTFNGYSFSSRGARYQNFQSTRPGDVITIVHAPGFETSAAEQRIGRTPLRWTYDVAFDGVSRREPDFATADVVGRFDVYPRVSLPLLWKGFSLRPQVGVRETYYSDRLFTADSQSRPERDAVNRRYAAFEVEARPPALSRIYEKPMLQHNFKHVIEPRLVYRNVQGIENFSSILRFDDRDIASDTHEVELGVVNRVYSKRIPKGAATCIPAPGEALAESVQRACDEGGSRELVTWELRTKYFLDPEFGGALVSGRRNVFTTTAELTGIAFLTQPRRFSPIVSRLRLRSATNVDVEWHFDYDPRETQISSSMALVNYRFLRDFFVGGGHAFLRSPGEVATTQPIQSSAEFNQFRMLLQYGRLNKPGLNLAGSFAYDANLGFLQYSAFQTTYNWDCCGLSFEFRRFSLGRQEPGIALRNERQIRFALTLANIGTFGTLRRQERLF